MFEASKLKGLGYEYRSFNGRYLINTTSGSLIYVPRNEITGFQLVNNFPAGSKKTYIFEGDGKIYFLSTLELESLRVGDFHKFDFEKI